MSGTREAGLPGGRMRSKGGLWASVRGCGCDSYAAMGARPTPQAGAGQRELRAQHWDWPPHLRASLPCHTHTHNSTPPPFTPMGTCPCTRCCS